MDVRSAAVVSGVVGLVASLVGAVSSGPAEATFPGRNGLVSFHRGGNVYTFDPVSRVTRQLTTAGGTSGATWSPDGTRLAYRKSKTIVVRSVATGATTTVARAADSAPSWSPDGRSLAFVAELPDAPCGEQAVFTVPATGAAAPRLAYDPRSDNCPHGTDVFELGTYTAGGQSLLLTTCYAYRDDSCAVDEVSTDPSNPTSRRVLEIRCAEESTPVDGWPGTCDYGLHLSDAQIGPGGNGILFSGKGGEPPLPGSSSFPAGALEKVYVTDRSGTGLHRVSTAANGHGATWSPSGGVVLFTQKAGTTSNVMRVSGTSATATATVLVKNASQPDWQPVP